jgi:uncharacterized iron-regulated protein
MAIDQNPAPAPGAACLTPGNWYTLSGEAPRRVSPAEVVQLAAARDVVLLGEHHDDPDHHLWQLQTLSALYIARPKITIGFESFPRRVQPVLDRWIAGELTEQQFLAAVDWKKIWNLPAPLYLPLFNFARINRIPIFALNVESSLTRDIGRKGWDAIPPAQREGVSQPASPSRAYEASLLEAFSRHGPAEGKRSVDRNDPAFRRFVDAQITWDRAMAEALALRVKHGDAPALVVGIAGAGHVEHGYGIPHQLSDLGIDRVAILLPVSAKTACGDLERTLADAVFALPADPHDKPESDSPKRVSDLK